MTKNIVTDEDRAACDATPVEVCAERCDDWCWAAMQRQWDEDD